jgi:pyrroloquinoline quinone biosynthesis protein B
VRLLVLWAGPSSGDGPGERTPPVLALGDETGQWVLLNAAAPAANALRSEPRLARFGDRDDEGGARAVVLTDGGIDQATGLLGLRRGAPIRLYATPAVFEGLAPALPALQRSCGLQWKVLPVAGDRRVAEFRVDGMHTLEFTAIATPAPVRRASDGAPAPTVGDRIALAVRDAATGARLYCATGSSHLDAEERDWMSGADCVLVDAPANDVAALDHIARLPARHKLLCGATAMSAPERRGLLSARAGLELVL